MSNHKRDVPLVVIGAGPGGYAAAFAAADKRMKVALVDPSEQLGGVCLNRGCIPSKALLHLARVISETHETEAMGLRFGPPQIEVDAIRSRALSYLTRRRLISIADLWRKVLHSWPRRHGTALV